MTEGHDIGGEPDIFGRCSECGEIYPVQQQEDGSIRPVGTDGTCRCGGDDFVILTEEE